MPEIARRTLLKSAGLLGAGLAMTSLFPAWARSNSTGLVRDLPTVSGTDIKLRIGHTTWPVDGRQGHAVTINGTVPGPLIRLKEGQIARIAVTNDLHEDTSIHWHGLILPFHMDGVPGVSFPGIKPGETFVYEFPVVQAGTYWYHSHSGLQDRRATTARSSSSRRPPTPSPTTGSTWSCSRTSRSCIRTRSSRS